MDSYQNIGKLKVKLNFKLVFVVLFSYCLLTGEARPIKHGESHPLNKENIGDAR